MGDRLWMDPSWAIENREPLELTPWVKAEGVDYGDAAVNAIKAEREYGEPTLDVTFPNRQMTIPLIPRTIGGTTFAQIRSAIQTRTALWQREGGCLGRENAQGTASVQVQVAGLNLGGGALQSLQRVDPDAVLELETLPGWEEAEVELSLHEEKTNPELIFTEATIKGDMPAPVRVEVIEKQAQDQKGLIWAFRSRYYSSATTAKSAYEAEELAPLGEATKGTLSGASNGTAVSNTALPAVWTPVLGTNIGGSTYLTHKGTNRVFARLRSPDGTAVAARLVWDVGDLVNPSENPAWRFPAGSAFFDADLGEVRLDPAPVGSHRWQGQIQAMGTEGGEDINVDKVWIVNEGEGMGILSAPPQASVGELKAWDNFNTTSAGTITGKVAPLGGTWSGAGDAVGFTVDTTNHWITRAETADAGEYQGYYARLGAGTASVVSAEVQTRASAIPSSGGALTMGLFVRYLNSTNFLVVRASINWPGTPPTSRIISLHKMVAGNPTKLGNIYVAPLTTANQVLKVTVDATGNAVVYEGSSSSSLSPIITATDAALATGGTLASGGYGIYDGYMGFESITRYYDNFYITVPTAPNDAVMFASQKAQLSTQGMYRLDSGGTAYGPVSRVIGDLPRIPPTTGGRTTEIFIKASRGDFDQMADSGIDDIAAKVYYKPTWLTFPGV